MPGRRRRSGTASARDSTFAYFLLTERPGRVVRKFKSCRGAGWLTGWLAGRLFWLEGASAAHGRLGRRVGGAASGNGTDGTGSDGRDKNLPPSVRSTPKLEPGVQPGKGRGGRAHARDFAHGTHRSGGHGSGGCRASESSEVQPFCASSGTHNTQYSTSTYRVEASAIRMRSHGRENGHARAAT